MAVPGVLQHLSPTKLVMKSFPLNAECFGLFGVSQEGFVHLAWAPTQGGRRPGLRKKLNVVTNTQLKLGGKWSDGNTGTSIKGRGMA